MPGAGERKPGSTTRHAVDALEVADSPSTLRTRVRDWRHAGATVALVPTMGALHAGHMALVAEARSRAARTVVSIFVNPAQFSPAEDLDRYPRTFDADCALLADAGVDLVYAPSVADVYPAGFDTRVVPGGPATVGLEDAARPHFFAGVATIVAKLLMQAMPDVAVFGLKDYQQLRVVTAMVRDLDLPVEIVPVETVREVDGLALSSRNRFLSADGRRRAGTLHRALQDAAAAIRSGTLIEVALSAGRDTVLGAGCTLDYFEARDAVSLRAPEAGAIRLLVAARIGDVRLIDNVGLQDRGEEDADRADSRRG